MMLTGVQSTSPASAQAGQQQQKLEKAAHEFEGMLISSLWSGFQNDPMTAPDDSDPGADSIKSLGLQAMSSALAAHGGLGLANMIVHQLSPLKSAQPADDKEGVARPPQSAIEVTR